MDQFSTSNEHFSLGNLPGGRAPGFVSTGEDVLIGGIILTGNNNAGVLFRAIGPSLSGVSDVLDDPMIEIFDDQGNSIATNDN